MSLADTTAAEIREECLRRFLSYVAVHTTSDEDSGKHPSTERQFTLARMLREELLSIGARAEQIYRPSKRGAVLRLVFGTRQACPTY